MSLNFFGCIQSKLYTIIVMITIIYNCPINYKYYWKEWWNIW